MVKYPAQLDDNSSLPEVTDNKSPVQADVVNRLRSAIVAVEAELGVKPIGITTINNLGDVSNPGIVTFGVPQHIMVTYNTGIGFDLYVDGLLTNHRGPGDGALPTTHSVIIGNDLAGNFPFNGWITQARVSNIQRSISYATATAEKLFAM